MKYGFFATTSTAAILSLGFASTALADVTADDIWQNWQDLGAASGQSYTAGKTDRSGDTLTLTDLTVEMTSADSDLNGVIPEVVFKETADGRVEITMSESYVLEMTFKTPEGTENTAEIAIDQTGMVLTASGTPDEINYDMAAETFGIALDGLSSEDAPEDLIVEMTISDMAAGYVVKKADMLLVTSTFSGSALDFELSGTDKKNNSKFKAMGEMSGLAGASNGAMPGSAQQTDLPTMLISGFATDAAFTYDGGMMKIETVDENGSTMNIESSSKGGKLNISIDRNRIAYGAGANGVSLKASGSAIPFPEVAAAYDEASFELLIPLAKSDEAQDFALNTRLKGLTVSDFLWGMIDPGATLPRDPASLVIETKGKAKPLVDILDEKKMEAALEAGPPAEIHSLDITALQLSVAGAALNGSGALTFDNSQPPALGGMTPMPTGKINLTLDGANGLLGKLQALGLVQPDMVMGFGMFAGMLAKPGAGPDSLISEIEIQEGGKILANGNPLPF